MNVTKYYLLSAMRLNLTNGTNKLRRLQTLNSELLYFTDISSLPVYNPMYSTIDVIGIHPCVNYMREYKFVTYANALLSAFAIYDKT